MPKIPNWSKKEDHPYAAWVHDETGERIEICPMDGTEWDGHGTPKKYKVDVYGPEGLNFRNKHLEVSSIKEAKRLAVRIAKDNPNERMVRTMQEKRLNEDIGGSERNKES